ncbi:hypothetical protein [Amaricoccus solimangrovi]|uniref:Dihydroorotate dehydrogenase n=1 Tax=Amaricoccus solimangrovi TaxID=2589815 RepID=A0A501WPJ1_9RHOB|nr:hypothetical protein [Amaricoccus solimangrovi]TPE50245.1 hypothetical protein FJM51_12745 [Amaricoccus solimangrovi]
MTEGKTDPGAATPRDPADLLETYFNAERRAEEPPSAAFLSAVLADAAEVAAARAEVAAPVSRPGAGSLWRALPALLGGWRGGAALTACALAGFLIGASGYSGLSTDLGGAAETTASASDGVSGFYDLAALDQ